MARALYNRDTLNRIRAFTAHGDGVHVIAREIGWSPTELRTVAKRHDIVLIEDTPAGKPAPRVKPVSTAVIEPAPAPRGVNKKFKSRGRLRANAIENHPRTFDILLKISAAARTQLARISTHHGQPIGTLVAVAIDHAARRGKIEALIIDALAEIEAQP